MFEAGHVARLLSCRVTYFILLRMTAALAMDSQVKYSSCVFYSTCAELPWLLRRFDAGKKSGKNAACQPHHSNITKQTQQRAISRHLIFRSL
jgi:hypothetical protein